MATRLLGCVTSVAVNALHPVEPDSCCGCNLSEGPWTCEGRIPCPGWRTHELSPWACVDWAATGPPAANATANVVISNVRNRTHTTTFARTADPRGVNSPMLPPHAFALLVARAV